jgi:hypothetical protein
MGPFTTSLPPESQQMLGPALDPRDPMTAILMAGSEHYTSSPYYPWGNTQNAGKMEANAPSFGGMYSTLAPSALENAKDISTSTPQPRDASNDSSTTSASGYGFPFAQESTNIKSMSSYNNGLSREDSASGFGSGQITPGEGFWDSFVQDGGWAEEAGAS